MSTTDLGPAIRIARVNAGLTQADVATAMGWASPARMSACESGKQRMSPRMAERLMAVIERLSAEGVPPNQPHPIRSHRLTAGVTQRALARELGFRQQSHLCQLELGVRRVSPAMELRILDAIARLASERP